MTFQAWRERKKASLFCLTCENLRECWEDESTRNFAGDWLAERVGFEPTVPFRTTVFETVRIGHSRTSPTNILFRSLSKTRLIYCGCAGFGQIFRSFSFNSPTIRLKRSKDLTQTSASSQRSLILDGLLGRNWLCLAKLLKEML